VSTFGGAELGCPVAERVLDISSSKAFLSRVNISAAKVGNGLDELREQYSDILTEVRQLGLFIGLKMNDMGYGPLMSIACYNNGLFAVYADNDKSVLQFLPPLTITDAEISFMFRSLNRAYSWARNNPKYLELARALVA
jgi:acetylornithine/succinyldiaminopimelate/putrescine aminotransferase